MIQIKDDEKKRETIAKKTQSATASATLRGTFGLSVVRKTHVEWKKTCASVRFDLCVEQLSVSVRALAVRYCSHVIFHIFIAFKSFDRPNDTQLSCVFIAGM